MNLAEALNNALPDIPVRARAKGYPKLRPELVWREHTEQGETIVNAVIPGGEYLFRFSDLQWKLAQLCDGERSYEQLSEALYLQTGAALTPAEVKDYTDGLDEVGFWYQSPQEKTFTLNDKLSAERKKHVKRKSKVGDLSMIYVAWWNPDAYLTWLYGKAKFLYSRWFTIAVLCSFVFMAYVFFQGRAEIWRDTVKFYTFTEKSFSDLVEFWVLFLMLGFFHESAHGLTCKHFGGAVHKMGFLLIYLSPAFFVEVNEIYVFGGKWQRIATAIAGIYVELIFCCAGTVVWWGTAAGSFAHEFAYKIMLITGVAVVLMNLNPLIKLDGYHIFTELVEFANLKERSTAFVSTWIRKHLFGLPVEIEYVPPRRRWYVVVYALLSGLYSYTVLFIVVRLTYNIIKHYSPDWAFLPACFVAWLIFRSRIKNLGRFMKTVYLDKRERVRAWLTPSRVAAIAVALLVVLFAPVWRGTVEGRFILEPVKREMVRASVPGVVVGISATEGQKITAGATLAELRDLGLESEAAHARAELKAATARATRAQLRYADYGRAERERQHLAERSVLLADKASRVSVVSPITGTVVSPRPTDLLGSYLVAGGKVCEVADLSAMRARIYLPEFEIGKVGLNAPARVKPDGMFFSRPAKVAGISPNSSAVADGLMHKVDFKGVHESQYYTADILIPNADGQLRDGMPGTAKVLVGRRSLAGFLWQGVHEFAARKLW